MLSKVRHDAVATAAAAAMKSKENIFVNNL